MKSKKLMLVLLLTILPIKMIFSNPSQENKKISATELGIDLNKKYTGKEVEDIINIILDEADKSIENSYYEGYKQATLELQPTIDILQYRINTKDDTKFLSYVTTATVGFGLGCLFGGITGICINLKLND